MLGAVSRFAPLTPLRPSRFRLLPPIQLRGTRQRQGHTAVAASASAPAPALAVGRYRVSAAHLRFVFENGCLLWTEKGHQFRAPAHFAHTLRPRVHTGAGSCFRPPSSRRTRHQQHRQRQQQQIRDSLVSSKERSFAAISTRWFLNFSFTLAATWTCTDHLGVP